MSKKFILLILMAVILTSLNITFASDEEWRSYEFSGGNDISCTIRFPSSWKVESIYPNHTDLISPDRNIFVSIITANNIGLPLPQYIRKEIALAWWNFELEELEPRKLAEIDGYQADLKSTGENAFDIEKGRIVAMSLHSLNSNLTLEIDIGIKSSTESFELSEKILNTLRIYTRLREEYPRSLTLVPIDYINRDDALISAMRGFLMMHSQSEGKFPEDKAELEGNFDISVDFHFYKGYNYDNATGEIDPIPPEIETEGLALMIEDEIKVYSEPNRSSETIDTIKDTAPLDLLDLVIVNGQYFDQWCLVKLPSDQLGWISINEMNFVPKEE